MKPIIEVQNLSKKYTIGATQPRYLSLRDSLTSTFKGVKNWTNFDKSTPITNEFWALQNIDFQLNAGESVGIIGRNGAGKSTLLKILSRITPPTSGHAILRGRLASLLEVGTGFHPELTGRENVYFNGSILGLKKTEIDKKFDEIVDFSGIERFIDTPLKNYSSGMQLRLAFAVAAHLEPEILIIDEVLAVGDAEFQKKCLGKMDDVSKSGRTVIFVSHNMGVVKNLCTKGILLNLGQIESIGSMRDVANKYLTNIDQDSRLMDWQTPDYQKVTHEYFTPTRFALVDKTLNILTTYTSNDNAIGVLIESQIKTLHHGLTIGIAVYSSSEELLFWAYQTDKMPDSTIALQKGLNKWIAWLPPHFLNEGDYFIELIGGINNQFWICEPKSDVPKIRLTIKEGLSKSPYWTSPRPGMLAPHIDFQVFND